MAGAALAAGLAAVALITIFHGPPPGTPVATLSGPGGQAACSAVFSPDRATLAVSDCKDSVYVRDVAARRWIATLTTPRCPDAMQVVSSPEGKTLAVFSGARPTVCLWDVAARRETTLTDPGPHTHLPNIGTPGTAGAFSRSGTTLAVADYNGNIYLWDLGTRRVTATVPASGDCDQGCPVAFSPDGATLAVGENDGSCEHIYLWDLASRRWAATLTDPRVNNGNGFAFCSPADGLAVTSLAFSRNGVLAAGDGNGRVYLWDAATRRLTATIAPPINVAAGNASISKDSADGGPYPAPGDFPQNVNVAFSPDGTTLATDVSFGYGTYLYDVATRNRLATLTDPGGWFWAPSAVFSPDGTMLAVTDHGHAYLWRLPRPRLAS